MKIIVAFLLSVLSGMGVGGGGLLVIYLSLAQGMNQHQAQGINLIFFLSASLSALTFNVKSRKFCIPRLAVTVLIGVPCAIFGSFLASRVDTALLRRLFGGLLILSGALALFRREKQ